MERVKEWEEKKDKEVGNGRRDVVLDGTIHGVKGERALKDEQTISLVSPLFFN